MASWARRCAATAVNSRRTSTTTTRMHDVFHLSYAAVLGWSPVMRSLMRRKRKSDPAIDEAEDGGRAIAIEEGISTMVFSYASRHNRADPAARGR
ncbi:hypothetical protein [Actinomadura sp. 9N407]|uniref:hypothetical protein n=1 Tax=Actinomadura sp. 9N407 TaxID=3375154 RepID=UPI0037AFD153